MAGGDTTVRRGERTEWPFWRIGDLSVDLSRHTVERGGEIVHLPDLSYRMLTCLMHAAPEAVSTAALKGEVWGEATVTDETVKQRITLLRKSLGDDARGSSYVETVRGSGYRIATRPIRAEAPHPARRLRRSGRFAGVLISLVAMVAIGVAAWTGLRGTGPTPDGVPVRAQHRLLVLPLRDLSPPGGDRSFQQQLEDRLPAAIAQIPGLIVVPVDPTQGTDPEQLRAAGIHLALRGTVSVRPALVSLSLELRDLDTDAVRWSRRYREEIGADGYGELVERIEADLAAELTRDD